MPPVSAPALRLTGRSTSHFTRVARIFALELGLPVALEVVKDLTSHDVAVFGGNPALKIPTLHVGDAPVFGAENACRRLVELAGRAEDPRVVLAHRVDADVARNAQELVWHAMSAQVQLVLGVVLGKLPADHPFFAKGRRGLEGALAWLEARWPEARAALPSARDVSLLEVTLFCLLEHLVFRPTLPLDPYPTLRAFAAEYGERPAARETPYRVDP